MIPLNIQIWPVHIHKSWILNVSFFLSLFSSLFSFYGFRRFAKSSAIKLSINLISNEFSKNSLTILIIILFLQRLANDVILQSNDVQMFSFKIILTVNYYFCCCYFSAAPSRLNTRESILWNGKGYPISLVAWIRSAQNTIHD